MLGNARRSSTWMLFLLLLTVLLDDDNYTETRIVGCTAAARHDELEVYTRDVYIYNGDFICYIVCIIIEEVQAKEMNAIV